MSNSVLKLMGVEVYTRRQPERGIDFSRFDNYLLTEKKGEALCLLCAEKAADSQQALAQKLLTAIAFSLRTELKPLQIPELLLQARTLPLLMMSEAVPHTAAARQLLHLPSLNQLLVDPLLKSRIWTTLLQEPRLNAAVKRAWGW